MNLYDSRVQWGPALSFGIQSGHLFGWGRKSDVPQRPKILYVEDRCLRRERRSGENKWCAAKAPNSQPSLETPASRHVLRSVTTEELQGEITHEISVYT